jgi:hypothetical protein
MPDSIASKTNPVTGRRAVATGAISDDDRATGHASGAASATPARELPVRTAMPSRVEQGSQTPGAPRITGEGAS